MQEYESLFAEVSSFPRLTAAFAAYLGKDKVAQSRNLMKPTKEFNLKTKTGWTQAKGSAKARTTLLTHYSPPWTAVRGEDR